jgi:hypothetical protein
MSTNNIPLQIERIVQQALLDYACKHRISPLYAVHCNLYKSLRSEGFLDEENYQRLMTKFSMKLVKEEIKPLSLEQTKRKQHLEEMQRTFATVLEEWKNPNRPVTWREMWLRQAEKYKDQIPEANFLLAKVTDKVFVK